MKYLNKNISNISFMNIFFEKMYYNGELIWSIVNNIFNCFSSGIWSEDKSWTNTDLWKS